MKRRELLAAGALIAVAPKTVAAKSWPTGIRKVVIGGSVLASPDYAAAASGPIQTVKLSIGELIDIARLVGSQHGLELHDVMETDRPVGPSLGLEYYQPSTQFYACVAMSFERLGKAQNRGGKPALFDSVDQAVNTLRKKYFNA